jgi:hypothetical protein
MATPYDIEDIRAAKAAAAKSGGLKSVAEQLQQSLTESKARQTTASEDLKAAQAAKAQAELAKRDAATALMQATGTKDIAAAQAAAAAKDVSKNPFVVQAQKAVDAAKANIPINKPTAKKIVGYTVYIDPQSGAQYGVPRYDDGTDGFADRNSWILNYGKQDSNGSSQNSSNQKPQTYTAPDGRIFTDLNEYNNYLAKLKLEQGRGQRQSAYDLLYEQFNAYGLGSLVTPLKSLIEQDVSPAEFTLKLRETDAYKKRFAANAARTAKGLAALSEADYINLEDRYQRVMRQYGLPESYYAKGELGAQPGFEKLIAADVRDDELADRLGTAYNRVINAAPEITTALKRFYPDITNGDILAYVLDPQKGLLEINRKVTAAEIGGAALGAGLATDMARAEELVGRGVTGAQAQQGYQTIGGGLKRGSELASIYQQPDYTQTTAEQEVFGLPSATEAQRKRKQLIGLETSTFGGRTGAGGALTRERAGQF